MTRRDATEGGTAPARSMRAAAAWALTVLALGATATVAQAAPASDSVLVKVDPDAGHGGRSDVGQALDADASRPLMAGWAAYDLPEPVTLAQARDLLVDEPAADAVSLDQRVQAFEVPNDPLYADYQWALRTISAPAGWDASTGAAQVVVAVIDTGVDVSHPDLSGRIWRNTGETAGNGIDDDFNGYVDDVNGWNFFSGTNQLYSAADGDSHGTHVAGTIAARRGNSYGVAGVADNARIMPLKFLGPSGGYTSDAIFAIQYAVAKGAKVINASWGGSSYSAPLCDAIAQAGAAGVLVVAAAGNDGTNNDAPATAVWPANCSAGTLVSVAATTQAEALAPFSNRGAATVDVGAPGDVIASILPGSSFGYKSGTSMAAPHVSGIAAIVRGKYPSFTATQLRSAVLWGGRSIPALAGTTATGRRADLLGALAVAAGGVGPDGMPPAAFSLLAPAQGVVTPLAGPVFRWTPASDADSGVTAYRLVIDGATSASVGSTTTASGPSGPLGDGPHTWSVVALDAEGNARASETRTIVVDRTPPTVAAPSSPAAGARVTGLSVRLRWAPAGDANGIAGYRVVVDGAPAASLTGAETTALVRMTAGRHSWQVVATDVVGNESTSAPRAIVVAAGPAATSARGRLTLSRLGGPVKPGARPRLRVKVDRAARISFSVRKASGGRTLASQARRLKAGSSTVVLSPTLARRIAKPGVYVVTARAAGMRDSVRLSVRGRR
jgi:subtilisin family serine protease